MPSLLASSFSEPGKFSFYNVVLFIHIVAILIAFGVTFAYPVLLGTVKRLAPQSMASFSQVGAVGAASSLLVLVAAFLMVTKLGA